MKFSELKIDQFFLCQNHIGDWYGWRKITQSSAIPLSRVGRPIASPVIFEAIDEVAVWA